MRHGNDIIEYLKDGNVKFKCKNYEPHVHDPHCSTSEHFCPIMKFILKQHRLEPPVELYDCNTGIAVLSWTSYLKYSNMDKIK